MFSKILHNCFVNLTNFAILLQLESSHIEYENVGQNVPWTKRPMAFLTKWTKRPTSFFQGGQNVPHDFDRVDKASDAILTGWTKRPMLFRQGGQNVPYS